MTGSKNKIYFARDKINYADVVGDTRHVISQGHMAQWIKILVRSSDIPKKSVSSISGEGSGELSEGKLTGGNW